jgi:hypothetical protein
MKEWHPFIHQTCMVTKGRELKVILPIRYTFMHWFKGEIASSTCHPCITQCTRMAVRQNRLHVGTVLKTLPRILLYTPTCGIQV